MKVESESPESSPLTRRAIMIKGITGAVALAGFGSRAGVAFAGVPGINRGETPGLTEGPYWVDGQLERIDVRENTSTSTVEAGMPLYLGLLVSQLSDSAPYTTSPLSGAKVDIWSANAQGVYSDESSQGTTGDNYLRGYQVTNARGVVDFLTIFPGWYRGRTPHIHIRIRTYSGTTVTYDFTTQLFFNEEITHSIYSSNSAYSRTKIQTTYNFDDYIFQGASQNGSPESEAGDYMLLSLATDGNSLQGSFHLVIDLSDTANEDPTGGTETGGGGGPPSQANAVTTTTGASKSKSKGKTKTSKRKGSSR